jgi:hypothetical protein
MAHCTRAAILCFFDVIVKMLFKIASAGDAQLEWTFVVNHHGTRAADRRKQYQGFRHLLCLSCFNPLASVFDS